MQIIKSKVYVIMLIIAIIMVFSMVAASATPAYADGTDPTVLWDTSGSWIATSEEYCDITNVKVKDVTVESYEWTDSTTCNVVLAPDTLRKASFLLCIKREGSASSDSGVDINGTSDTAMDIPHIIQLSNGTASVTIQPVCMYGNGTAKTFNFSINGGGTFEVTHSTGQGYTVTPVGDSASHVNNQGDYTFAVNIENGFKKGPYFTVKVNNEVIELDNNDRFTISNITENKYIKVEDVIEEDTCFYWDNLIDGNGWFGRSEWWCYIMRVSSFYVSVKDYEWVDSTTCNIDLVPETESDAEFMFHIQNHTAPLKPNVGVIVDNNAISGSDRYFVRQLKDGKKTITVKPYAYGSDSPSESYEGTLKTFNFRIAHGKITSAKALLENDITMKLYATFTEAPDEGTVSMEVTMNDETTELEGTLQNDGRYLFEFKGISPENINDEFTAVMSYAIGDEQYKDTLENYSVAKYCKTVLRMEDDKLSAIIPSTATLAETRQLMVDTLFYGAEAQNYNNYHTDRLATSDLSEDEAALASTYVTPTAAEGVISPMLSGTKNDDYFWSSASVALDNSAKMKLFFKAPNGIEGLTVTAGGEEREIKTTTTAGKYYVEVSGISADAFGVPVNATFTVNGQTTGQTLSYNINTYVKQTENHDKFGPMAQRMYNYGKSAKAYTIA